MKKKTNTQEKSFKENGYITIKNIINKNIIKKIQKIIIKKSKNYLKPSKNFKSFYDKSLHQGLIDLKKTTLQDLALFMMVFKNLWG